MIYTRSELIVLPIALLCILILSITSYFILKNKSEKVKNIPLAIIAILILLLEGAKQIRSAVMGTYNSWTIPLHFCSLFIFFFPLATLVPNKKIKAFGSTMSLACSLWMTVLFYFGPRTIIGGSCENIFASFYNFHTFFYHHLVILYLFTGIALNQFKISKKFYIHTLIGMTTYALIAVPAAHLLNTNYCNILTSNIPFMETIRINYGQVLYTIFLYLAGLVGATLSCFLYRIIRKGGEINE